MRRIRMCLPTLVLVGAMLTGMAALSGAGAEEPGAAVPAADRAAIRSVIQTQLDAFRRDDADAAFALAAPGLRHHFGDDPAIFLGMVRQGYQPVYRPRSAVFGAAGITDGQVTQKLEVVGPEGAGHEAIYLMEHEADGSWRIGGCVLTDSSAVGA